MDLADIPEILIAKIASYLNKLDLLACCHVNTKWYKTFNQDFVFKKSCKINYDIDMKVQLWIPNPKEVKQISTPSPDEVIEVCTHFHHCELLRDFLLQHILLKKLLNQISQKRSQVFKVAQDLRNIGGKMRKTMDEIGKIRKELTNTSKPKEHLEQIEKELNEKQEKYNEERIQLNIKRSDVTTVMREFMQTRNKVLESCDTLVKSRECPISKNRRFTDAELSQRLQNSTTLSQVSC